MIAGLYKDTPDIVVKRFSIIQIYIYIDSIYLNNRIKNSTLSEIHPKLCFSVLKLEFYSYFKSFFFILFTRIKFIKGFCLTLRRVDFLNAKYNPFFFFFFYLVFLIHYVINCSETNPL